METDSTSQSQPVPASESSRKQRDGTKFIGGYGKKTGDSELLFIEGQFSEKDDRTASDGAPTH